jgi:hypothetical protein
MSEIGQLIERFGISVAILISLFWFLYKVLWPWMTKQIEEANKERRESTDRMARLLEQHNEESRQIVSALQVISAKLDRRR